MPRILINVYSKWPILIHTPLKEESVNENFHSYLSAWRGRRPQSSLEGRRCHGNGTHTISCRSHMLVGLSCEESIYLNSEHYCRIQCAPRNGI